MHRHPYIGRFAPSPTGPLHAGSLVAAVASYLDARMHHGRWLLRIEDVDEARTVAGSTEMVQQALTTFGMQWDDAIEWQSLRKDLYAAALAHLEANVYPCGCSRREIADSRIGVAADGAAVYPGTCRHGLAQGKVARAMRLRVPEAGAPDEWLHFDDRWIGAVSQHLASEVGDFVLKRADGFWAYQLAVVVDDEAQGVTHIVRGADLLDSTARQIYLQGLLGYSTPQYLHVPVVVNSEGEKLSKQTGAKALNLERPEFELMQAARVLGLAIAPVESVEEFWRKAVPAWAHRLAALPVG